MGKETIYPSESKVDDHEKKSASEQPRLVSMSRLFAFADMTDKILMFVGTFCACGTGFIQPIQVVAFGDVINAFNPSSGLSDEETQAQINQVCLYFVYIALVSLVFGFGQVACWAIAAARQTRKLKLEYVKAILRQEVGWFDVNKPTELATRVADSTLTVQDGMGRKVGDGAQFFAMAVGGIGIAMIEGYKLSLVLLAFMPALAFTAFLMMKILGDAVHGGSEAYATAGGIAEETIGNIRTVQSFNGMAHASKKYAAALDGTEKAGVKKGFGVGIGTGLMFFSVFCAYGFGMFYGAVLVYDDFEAECVTDCYDGGRVLIVFFSTIMGATALGQAGPSFEAMFKARAAAVPIFDTIDRKSLIDPTDVSGIALSHTSGSISIENVTFRYPSRPEIVVCKNYSLQVAAGETVALVGSSGCGKSTTVGLLERFYDPEAGVVKIDGQDIKQFTVSSLRTQIGLVSQEPSLFQTTIAKNIAMGKPGASLDEIQEAARKANAYDFIMDMPEGFETEVGERGVQLSGGQKQRIAIARAIIKDPSILLLDEATSALDTESEFVVQQSLDQLLAQKKRTTIVIAHRLSTIRNADKIAYLENGSVVELGSHDELMKIPDGKYVSLVQKSKTTTTGAGGSGGLIATTTLEEEVLQPKATSIEENVAPLDAPTVQIKTANDPIANPHDKKAVVPMKRLWRMSQPDTPYVIIGSIGAAVNGAVFPLWGVLLTKATVTFFRTDLPRNEMLHEARMWALGFVALGVVFCGAMVMQNWGFAIVSERLTKRLRILGFQAVLRQEIGWFDREENTSGAVTTRLAGDAALVQSMTSEMLNRNLVTLFTLGIAFGIAFAYSWEMTLILLAAFPFMSIGSYIQMQAFEGTASKKTANSGDSKAGSLLTEAVGNHRTVASFTIEDHILSLYYGFLSQAKDTDRKAGLSGGAGFGFANGIIFAVQAFMFWAGGLLVFEAERITFEDMFMVLLAIMFSSFGLGMAAQNMADAGKAKEAALNLFSIIDRKPEIDATGAGGAKPEAVKGKVEFTNVDFAYPTRKEAQIYKQYCLTIEPGMTVALVGASGGGKSTAIGLLERFYNPDAGSIKIDGHELSALNIAWLRDHISLVSQEPVLFRGTIAENIMYGKPDATRAEVEEAAKKSNAYDFITQFPEGFDTDVGNRGIQVSGGQKQRIALARAIIRDPKVLLLDEATSALDSESEKIVQASLEKLMQLKKRTTIVIAHRLSTIRDADLIAVVHEGRIAELGKHEELVGKDDGIYRKLVQRQAKLHD